MSTNYIRLIPTDPRPVPDPVEALRARAYSAAAVPDAAVTAETFKSVAFVDQGENRESVSCPNCGAVLDAGWWTEPMDTASEVRFQQLEVVVPCCSASVSLNDLVYVFPAGFARFVPVRQGSQRA